MTIKEIDFKSFAQVRPEIVELADRLVALLPLREDEHFAFTRVGLIYRNQGWRECLLTGRSVTRSFKESRLSGKDHKDSYATYQMPNGKVYKVAIDMVTEQMAEDVTLCVCPFDLDEHIGIPC